MAPVCDFLAERVRVRGAAALLLSVAAWLNVSCDLGDEGGVVGSTTHSLTSTDGSTGVAECDRYLDEYELCIQSQLSGSLFNQHKQGILRQRQMWRDMADSPFKKQALARVCLEATRTGSAEFPTCSWTDTQ